VAELNFLMLILFVGWIILDLDACWCRCLLIPKLRLGNDATAQADVLQAGAVATEDAGFVFLTLLLLPCELSLRLV